MIARQDPTPKAKSLSEPIRNVQSVIAHHVLQSSGQKIELDMPFSSIDVDSLAGIELIASLRSEFSDADVLSEDLLFSQVTIRELAQQLTISEGLCDVQEQVHTTLEIAPQVAAPQVAAQLHARMVTVGVTGMACVLAGQHRTPPQPETELCGSGGVCTPDEMWSSLVACRDHLNRPVPARWRQACKLVNIPVSGGFINSCLPAPDRASTLDLHLESTISMALAALSDSSIQPNRSRVGVFTACAVMDFSSPCSPYLVSRLVAKELGFDGPHANTEHTCSSGYMSICKGSDTIVNGICDTAIVSGASLMLQTTGFVAERLPFLSSSLMMRPLDMNADGTIFGEGCAALVLCAVADPADVYSNVQGHASNTNSTILPVAFTSMDMIALSAAAALSASGLCAQEVSFSHLHAMGNPASDQPEVLGVARGLATGRSNLDPLVLAAHKAAFGHTVSTSGLIAFIYTTLILQHRQVPALQHINVALDCVRRDTRLLLPIVDAVELDSSIKIAAASLSGLSGSGDNVHLIVQQAGRGLAAWTTCYELDSSATHAAVSVCTVAGSGENPPVQPLAGREPAAAADDELPVAIGTSQATGKEIELLIVGCVQDIIGANVDLESQSLVQAGLKSKQIPALLQTLECCGLRLPETVVFSYPTVAELVLHIQQQASPSLVSAAAQAAVRRELQTESNPSTIIPSPPSAQDWTVTVAAVHCAASMGCTTSQKLWTLLCCATDELARPAHLQPDIANFSETPVLAGHHVQNSELFDAAYFRLSPAEVKVTDPNQRLLLECAASGFISAEFSREQLMGAHIGVFVGFGNLTAWVEVQRGMDRTSFSELGIASSAVAGRISFSLGSVLWD